MPERDRGQLSVAGLSGWRERMFVPVLVLVGLTMAVLSSLGAPLIPDISAANHVSLATGQWILTSTLLVGAVASPIAGQLADGRQRRLVLLWSLAVVLVGSGIASAVDGFAALLVGRSLQGLGLGMLPVAMTIARHHLRPRRASTVIGILSITASTGLGLGYPLTGLITEKSDYHVAFWVGTGLVAFTLICAIVVLPTDHACSPSRLDVVGAVLFTIALVALLVPLSEGGQWGWQSPVVVALFVVAAITLVVLVRYERRAAHPLVVLDHFRSRTVLVTNLVAAAISVAFLLFIPTMVEFVQIPRSAGYGFGTSVAVAGLALVPLSAGTVVAGSLLVRIRNRIGARATMILASIAFASGFVLFAFWHTDLWQAFVAMALAGVGIGFSFGAMAGYIVGAVPAHEVGSAMGLYQVVRATGTATGSAIGAAILATYTIAGHSVPGVGAYQLILIIGAAMCLSTIPMSFLLPRTPERVAGPPTVTETASPARSAVAS